MATSTKDMILGVAPTPQPTDSSLAGAAGNGGQKPTQPAGTTTAGATNTTTTNTTTTGTATQSATQQTGAANPVQTVKTQVQEASKQVDTNASVAQPVTLEGKPKRLSWAEMYEKMNAASKPMTPEEVAKEEKRRKRKAIFAAIGDGVSAIANIYSVSKGALNAQDGKNSMSAKLKSIWDKNDKERMAREKEYNAGYMNAQKMDADAEEREKQWNHQLEREAVADKRADEQSAFQKERARVQDEQWDKNFTRQGEQWQKQFDQSVHQFNVTSKQAQQRINMEGQRLKHELQNNGGVTFTLGNNQGSVHISKDRLNAQTVSYVFGKLPQDIRDTVQGEPIYGMVPVNPNAPNGLKEKGIIGYGQPKTEAMLVAIGMNASDENVSAALQEISGQKAKAQGKGYGDSSEQGRGY